MADSIIDKLKQQFRQGSVLLKLIYINVAIFLLLRLTWVVLMLFNIDGYVILPFIEMPSIPYEFITHPWTLLTYMFVHYDVWHILFNMLWLYWFGQIFLMSFSEKQMVGLYLLGGIAGGLLYLPPKGWRRSTAERRRSGVSTGPCGRSGAGGRQASGASDADA